MDHAAKETGSSQAYFESKKQNKENSEMKELAKRLIGEECIIYTITSNDGSVQGVIKKLTTAVWS